MDEEMRKMLIDCICSCSVVVSRLWSHLACDVDHRNLKPMRAISYQTGVPADPEVSNELTSYEREPLHYV